MERAATSVRHHRDGMESVGEVHSVTDSTSRRLSDRSRLPSGRPAPANESDVQDT